MLFNSLEFLLFFPLVTLVTFLLPRRGQTVWLLAASYYFYMCWNPVYALLMLFSTAATYGSGLLLQRAVTRRRRRLIAGAALLLNFGILVYFKYSGFLVAAVNRGFSLLGLDVGFLAPEVLLPVGISFYTFQALSYTLDVYRGQEAEKNFLIYALYVSFYPQLVAGPIERSGDILFQLKQRLSFDFDHMRRGLALMLWGFFLKLCLADRFSLLVDPLYNDPGAASGAALLLATAAFGLQIYCDFAAYSAIARGAAGVLGVRLSENFREPYLSTSLAEFWRRWHLTLSQWFRDYLYFPLGGSRRGTGRTCLNLILVFMVSGLWHGAAWTFVFWGLGHGVLQALGRLLKPAREKLCALLHLPKLLRRLLGWAFTLCEVTLLWVFFRANGVSDALLIFRRIFTEFGTLGELPLSDAQLWAAGVFLAVLLAVSLLRRFGKERSGDPRTEEGTLAGALCALPLPLRFGITLLLLLAVLVFGIYGPGYDAGAFIYFQF